MSNNLLNNFIDGGVYKLKNTENDIIFICNSVCGSMGKLTQYYCDEITPKNKLYIKTGNSYFLNSYVAGDYKELFLKRDNYDMVGKLDCNYFASLDREHKFVLTNIDFNEIEIEK